MIPIIYITKTSKRQAPRAFDITDKLNHLKPHVLFTFAAADKHAAILLHG